MKKHGSFLLLALLMVCLTAFSLSCEAAKKTIAVTGVENQASSSSGHRAAAELDAAITTILVKSGLYNVVERSQLDHVLRELGMHSSGLIAGESAIQLGQMTGAEYTVVGNVLAATMDRFDNYLYKGTKAKIKFNFKFINNKTGVIEIAEIIEGSDSVSEFENRNPNKAMMMSSAANDVAKQIMEKIDRLNPLSGIVISVDANIAYIDLGSDNGLKQGDNLLVYEEGRPIIHPVSGQIIAVKEEKIGALRVIEVHPNYALAEIKKGNGQIRANAKVKR